MWKGVGQIGQVGRVGQVGLMGRGGSIYYLRFTIGGHCATLRQAQDDLRKIGTLGSASPAMTNWVLLECLNP
jgi:hypothetical protein